TLVQDTAYYYLAISGTVDRKVVVGRVLYKRYALRLVHVAPVPDLLLEDLLLGPQVEDADLAIRLDGAGETAVLGTKHDRAGGKALLPEVFAGQNVVVAQHHAALRIGLTDE